MARGAGRPFAKGKSGNPKGRKPGPNKTTRDVREAIALLAQRNVDRVEGWLDEVAEKDPAKAIDLFTKLVDFHIPRLARQEVTGPGGGPLQVERVTFTLDATANPQ